MSVAKFLNLGCGSSIDPQAVNVDIVDLPGVDVVHDLDVMPWPFTDASFRYIWASHVFEHVRDPIGFMCEAHRILEPGGLLSITVPHYQSENSFTDPTHLRHCTERTWDYWCEGTALYGSFNAAYGAVGFHKRSVHRNGDDLIAELIR